MKLKEDKQRRYDCAETLFQIPDKQRVESSEPADHPQSERIGVIETFNDGGYADAGTQTELTMKDIEKMEDVLRQNTAELAGLHNKEMYHIVIFEKTNEVEVVPSRWVSGEECMWPHKTDVVKVMKTQEQPGADWIPFRSRVLFTSDDYSEARRKLPDAVLHTDLGTDGEDSPVKPKRRRV
uniref:Uncharacterized protein n=1 Tax=Nothobranchius korthausae TaxID=1143690 RepID=A0A1A8ENN8_9TELE